MGSFTRDREGNFRLTLGRSEVAVLIGFFRIMAVRSVLPSSFLRGADPWPQSGSKTRMEHSSRGDCALLAGLRALVGQVETGLRIVAWNPSADGVPRRFDGLEGFDV
jgi:hypothetical protein